MDEREWHYVKNWGVLAMRYIIIFLLFFYLIVGCEESDFITGINNSILEPVIVNNKNLSVSSIGTLTQKGSKIEFIRKDKPNDNITQEVLVVVSGNIYNINSMVSYGSKSVDNGYKWDVNISIPDNLSGQQFANNLEEIWFKSNTPKNVDFVSTGYRYLDSVVSENQYVNINSYVVVDYDDVMQNLTYEVFDIENNETYMKKVSYERIINKTSIKEKNNNEILYKFDVRNITFLAGQTIVIDPKIIIDNVGVTTATLRNVSQGHNHTYLNITRVANITNQSSLVLYVPFNRMNTTKDVFEDVSTNKFTYTCSAGCPVYSPPEDCAYGHCYNFIDGGDSINFGNVLDNDGTQAQTVIAWAKFDDVPTGSTNNMVGKKRSQGNQEGWAMGWGASDNIFFAQIQQDVSPSNRLLVASENPVPSGVWFMMTWVYDGDKAGSKLYVNDTFIPQTISQSTFTGSSSTDRVLRISGASTNGGALDRAFDGRIDEVMVFHTNLSIEQITSIYQNTSVRYSTGEQQFDNLNISESTGENRLNVSINVSNFLDSYIMLQVGESVAGGYNYGDYVNFTVTDFKGVANDIVISDPNNVSFNFRFVPGSYPDRFYAPTLDLDVHSSAGTVAAAPTGPDSCQYGGSGLWNISCADNCVLNATNLNQNNWEMFGVGTVTLTGALSNYVVGHIGHLCTVVCAFQGDCFFG